MKIRKHITREEIDAALKRFRAKGGQIMRAKPDGKAFPPFSAGYSHNPSTDGYLRLDAMLEGRK